MIFFEATEVVEDILCCC